MTDRGTPETFAEALGDPVAQAAVNDALSEAIGVPDVTPCPKEEGR